MPSYEIVADGSTYQKITNFETYKSWFELDTSAEGASAECLADKFEVVKKVGENYVPLENIDGTKMKLAELN